MGFEPRAFTLGLTPTAPCRLNTLIACCVWLWFKKLLWCLLHLPAPSDYLYWPFWMSRLSKLHRHHLLLQFYLSQFLCCTRLSSCTAYILHPWMYAMVYGVGGLCVLKILCLLTVSCSFVSDNHDNAVLQHHLNWLYSKRLKKTFQRET